jgi:hypothetical protein
VEEYPETLRIRPMALQTDTYALGYIAEMDVIMMIWALIVWVPFEFR